MDNKTKPSSLLLVPSHDDFDKPGILFEPEMLEWPICGRPNLGEVKRAIPIIYRNAMKALMNIAPFSAKLSFEIDLANKKLSLPERTWGKIYLNSDHVLSFSHNTNSNDAFYSIVQWPEIDFEGDNFELVFYNWDSNKWSEFFLERIKQEYIDLETKAKAKRNDAIALENRSFNIRLALSEK